MLIIIPTYNEIENIEAIIRAVFSRDERFHILIVDDNSPDGTAAKVKALQTEFPTRLFLEVRTEKKGLGTAYIHGFEWALAHDYDYIFEMDADFSHNPDDLLRLYEACCNGSDVAIGVCERRECSELASATHTALLRGVYLCANYYWNEDKRPYCGFRML